MADSKPENKCRLLFCRKSKGEQVDLLFSESIMNTMLCWAGQFWCHIAVLCVLLSTHRHTFSLSQSSIVLLHVTAVSASGIVRCDMGRW